MQKEAYKYMADRSKPGPFIIFSIFIIFLYISPIYSDRPTETIIIGAAFAITGTFRIITEFSFVSVYAKRKQYWITAYSLGVTSTAIIWGIFILLIVAEYGIHWISLLSLMATAGISAGGVFAVIPDKKLSLYFQIVTLLPTAFYSFTLGNAAAYSISYMFLVYLIFMTVTSRKLHDEYWTSVKNAHLLDERAKELEIARDKALDLAKIKSHFLATMSHELRTPMNGILGMSQLLELSKLNEEQTEYVSTIKKSTNSLLTIINDTLDLSKIESGKVTLEYQHFNIHTLIANIGKLLNQTIRKKGLAFAVHIDEDCPPDLIGDQGRIQQILLNLLGNAIKFTEHGSISINIKCIDEDDDCLIRFDVIDTGIGINLSSQSQIFSSFTQADSSTTRKYGGTGLGLTISKQLVTLMNGEIGIDSQEGAGSTFWFQLPLTTTGSTKIRERNETNASTDHSHGFALDSNILSQLKETMEDQYTQLIKAHIDSSTQTIKRIAQHIQNRDAENLGIHLNGLKSSSASIGAKALEAQASFIEKRLIKTGRLPDAEEHQKLINLFDDMIVALAEELE